MSDLNVKLQGANQHLSDLLSNVKSFKAELKLWQVQLERGWGPTLQGQEPEIMSEYASECGKLAFCELFKTS